MESLRQLDELNSHPRAAAALSRALLLHAPLLPPLRDLGPEDLDVLQLAHNFCKVRDRARQEPGLRRGHRAHRHEAHREALSQSRVTRRVTDAEKSVAIPRLGPRGARRAGRNAAAGRWFSPSGSCSSRSAVLVGSAVGTHIPAYVSDPDAQAEELSRSRLARAKVAWCSGSCVPALLTLLRARRRRRGGPHARGIRVEVTDDGELRLWGRGYGTRVALAGARVDETIGRSLRRAARSVARAPDYGVARRAERRSGHARGRRRRDLPLLGGEGDCVEFDREDYFALRDGHRGPGRDRLSIALLRRRARAPRALRRGRARRWPLPCSRERRGVVRMYEVRATKS